MIYIIDHECGDFDVPDVGKRSQGGMRDREIAFCPAIKKKSSYRARERAQHRYIYRILRPFFPTFFVACWLPQGEEPVRALTLCVMSESIFFAFCKEEISRREAPD